MIICPLFTIIFSWFDLNIKVKKHSAESGYQYCGHNRHARRYHYPKATDNGAISGYLEQIVSNYDFHDILPFKIDFRFVTSFATA